MKILLINPRFSVTSQPPLGLAYLSSYLKQVKGLADVKIVDTSWQSLENATKDLDRVDLVGIHVMSPYYHRAERVARFVRRRWPQAKLIVGGPHASVAPEHTLKLGADFGVIGEGEESFGELVSMLEKGQEIKNIPGIFSLDIDGSCVINTSRPPIKNLDALPFPDREALPMDEYLRRGIMQEFGFAALRATTILTSRGCPYRCLFCSRSFGRRIRYRSPENIIDEVKHLIARYGINGLFIVDDTFTVKKQHALAFCELVQKEGIKLSIALNSRVDAVTPELLKILQAAGVVSIAFGIESGDQKILDRLKKDITIEQVEAAVRYSKENGIHVKGYFMVGVPGDNMVTMKKTVGLAKRLPFDQVQFSIAMPYPGTGLWEKARELDLIESMDSTFDKGFMEGGAMRTEYLTVKQIQQFHHSVCRPLEYRRIIGGLLRDWRSLPYFLSYINSRRGRKAAEQQAQMKDLDTFPV